MPGLIEDNLAAYWLALTSLAGGEVRHDEDVVWAYTGEPVLNRMQAVANGTPPRTTCPGR